MYEAIKLHKFFGILDKVICKYEHLQTDENFMHHLLWILVRCLFYCWIYILLRHLLFIFKRVFRIAWWQKYTILLWRVLIVWAFWSMPLNKGWVALIFLAIRIFDLYLFWILLMYNFFFPHTLKDQGSNSLLIHSNFIALHYQLLIFIFKFFSSS